MWLLLIGVTLAVIYAIAAMVVYSFLLLVVLCQVILAWIADMEGLGRWLSAHRLNKRDSMGHERGSDT